jgi:hypothetical protein
LRLLAEQLADFRMGNGLQKEAIFLGLRGRAEDPLGQSGPIHLAVRPKDLLPPACPNRLLDMGHPKDLVACLVGIQDSGAQAGQFLSHYGLAAGHPA